LRVLIIGATGMLGHKMVQRLGQRFQVAGTVRGAASDAASHPALAGANLIGGISAGNLDGLAKLLDKQEPQAVINCVGVIKQLDGAKDPVTAIGLNALFPHQLARLCGERGMRTVHFSTDCVFSGKQGPYKDDDPSDAQDLYGRSKFLGEISGPGRLTLRSSIIGRELKQHAGLIEWFLAQRGGAAQGFTRALYTGLTTLAMADLVGDLLEHHPGLDGVWQVSSESINKFDLLSIVNRVYDLGVELRPEDEFFCDRRLDSSRFRQATGWQPKPWEQMIEEMGADPTSYE
jgi:dTDP-4-dehydrorhamnose reductase